MNESNGLPTRHSHKQAIARYKSIKILVSIIQMSRFANAECRLQNISSKNTINQAMVNELPRCLANSACNTV